jgi:hypothetical protein
MWKPVAAAIALASLATVVLLHAVEPVAAKPIAPTCQDKHGACVHRCIENNETIEAAFRCEQRTCNKQFNNCVAAMGKGGGGGKLSLPPGFDRPQLGIRSPLGSGILETGGGLSSQGPGAAGSPIGPAAAPAAPSAPPVIIR